MNKDVTYELLHELFRYEPETGKLFWKKNRSNIVVGSEAKSPQSNGYMRVAIYKKRYLTHRIAWFMCHGAWPTKQIDHINGVRTDNRIANLREVDNRKNQHNRKMNRAGRLFGATWNKRMKRWKSAIKVNKVFYHFGYFDAEIDAHKAYVNKCKELGVEI